MNFPLATNWCNEPLGTEWHQGDALWERMSTPEPIEAVRWEDVSRKSESLLDRLLRLAQQHKLPDGQHWLWAGKTRFGKSEGVLSQVLFPAMKAKDCAIVVVDAQGPLAKKFARLAFHHGNAYRMIVDEIRYKAKTPGYDIVAFPHGMDVDEREDFCEVSRELGKMKLLQRRHIATSANNPLIEECLDLLFDLYSYQPEPVPFCWLQHALDKTSNEHWHLCSRCLRGDIAKKAWRWANYDQRTWETKCGPGLRVVRAYAEKAAVRRRDGASFPFRDFLNGRLTGGDPGILILSGESHNDLAEESAQMILSTVIHETIAHCRAGAERGVILVIDEGQGSGSGLIDANIAKAMREQAKNGLSIHALVHNIRRFADEDTARTIFEMTNHIYYRVSDESAQIGGADIGVKQLNPLKIKYQETRFQQFTDGYEYRKTESSNTSKDQDGNERRGTTEGQQALAKHSVLTTTVDHYKDYSEQIMDVQQMLEILQPGYMLYCDKDGVSAEPVYTPMVEEPVELFPGYAEAAYQTALREMRERPWFRVPVRKEAPWVTYYMIDGRREERVKKKAASPGAKGVKRFAKGPRAGQSRTKNSPTSAGGPSSTKTSKNSNGKGKSST